MTLSQTAVLGALAGFTIFLGLPLGRLGNLGPRTRVALAMFSVGVLAFLFVDVLEHGLEILEDGVKGLAKGEEGPGEAVGLLLLMGLGFAAGSAGLATLERRMRPAGSTRPPVAGGSTEALGAAEAERFGVQVDAAHRRALQTGLTIAGAIGLHNFAEGLAIGVSASTGEIGLATVLIVGFALHNATEGFGIVGPLGNTRPSWRWLALAGLIGGGPTFLGSLVGYGVDSEPLQLAFYAVAAGAILYVIGEIWQGMRRVGHRELGLWLLSVGFMAGLITDLVVVYGGG